MQRVLAKDATKKPGLKIKVCGWVQTVRSHGQIIFFDLRDRSGVLQIVFTPKQGDIYKIAKEVRPEWVVSIEGEVQKRPPAMVNPKLTTGQIELQAERIEIFSKAKTLPFSIDTPGYEISEEKRLKYRYLDLRRHRMKLNLAFRQEIIHTIREFLLKEDFIEVETPNLTKATPEGARDYLVPSRLQPGKFYALPQSPQQYKQLLMVGGIERYFQMARCFRDEDPRADRQPEFTQLDLEMSFIDQDDILKLSEELYIDVVKKVFPEKRITKIPFPRLAYKDAMEKYKTDRPDLRRNKEDPDELSFCIVYDFPMFEWKEAEKRYDAVHHPFTRPKEEDITKIKAEPAKVLAYQYDFALNGEEVGGGSLRSFRPEVLEAVFEVMGHKKADIKRKFGHLLEAFEYGVPPHGGIAWGFDRFLMVLFKEKNIREVIAFPKTGDARDPMMQAPSDVDESQLKELKLEIKQKK